MNKAPVEPGVVEAGDDGGAKTRSAGDALTLIGEIYQGHARGLWGMTREAALSGDAYHTSDFEYSYDGDGVGGDCPQSGTYSGWFQFGRFGDRERVVETNVRFDFTASELTEDELDVVGSGTNRFGRFTISGTCGADGSCLDLTRRYIAPCAADPRPRPRPVSYTHLRAHET